MREWVKEKIVRPLLTVVLGATIGLGVGFYEGWTRKPPLGSDPNVQSVVQLVASESEQAEAEIKKAFDDAKTGKVPIEEAVNRIIASARRPLSDEVVKEIKAITIEAIGKAGEAATEKAKDEIIDAAAGAILGLIFAGKKLPKPTPSVSRLLSIRESTRSYVALPVKC